MKSRIIWSVLIVAAAALLVAGAVNRTMARSDLSSTGGSDATQQVRLGQAAATEAGVAKAEASSANRGSAATERLGGGNGQGQGQGAGRTSAEEGSSASAQGQGRGQGGGQGQGAVAAPLAAANELETLAATAVEVNDELLLLEQDNGERLEIGGRAWRYALENGFTVRNQERIQVVGFYDDASGANHFEPISIVNEGSGQEMQLREANGRPLWAGQGWRQAGT